MGAGAELSFGSLWRLHGGLGHSLPSVVLAEWVELPTGLSDIRGLVRREIQIERVQSPIRTPY